MDISSEKHSFFNLSSMILPEKASSTEENSSLKLSKAKRKNAKKHFGRKFKYDPALMLMGLGKRKPVYLHNGTKDFNLGEKKDTFHPVLGLGNGNSRSKRSMNAQPLMLITGIRESVITFNMQNHSLLDLNHNVTDLGSDDQLTYPNVAPFTKYEETEIKYFNNETSTAFGQNSSYKPQLGDVLGESSGKNIKRESKYDPVIRYLGLVSKGSGYNSLLKYAGLGKKNSAYDPALRYMGLGKRSHNFDPALKYMGLAKKSLHYDPALKYMGLGKKSYSYDPAIKGMRLGKKSSNYGSALKYMDLSKKSSSYDPALKYMGLGKKSSRYEPALKFVGIGKKSSSYDPALKYMGLGKKSSRYDPALKYMGLGKKSSSYDPALRYKRLGKNSSTSSYGTILSHKSEEKKISYYDPDLKYVDFGEESYDPALKYMGLGKKSNAYGPDVHLRYSNKKSSSFDPALRYMGLGKKSSSFDPALKYMGLGKINSNYNLPLKYRGLDKKRSSYDPALKYMGLGKKSYGFDPALKYMGLGKRNSNYNLPLKYIGLDKKRSSYDPALKYMGLGKKSYGFDPALKYMGLGEGNFNYDLKYVGLGKKGVSYDPALKSMGLRKRDPTTVLKESFYLNPYLKQSIAPKQTSFRLAVGLEKNNPNTGTVALNKAFKFETILGKHADEKENEIKNQFEPGLQVIGEGKIDPLSTEGGNRESAMYTDATRNDLHRGDDIILLQGVESQNSVRSNHPAIHDEITTKYLKHNQMNALKKSESLPAAICRKSCKVSSRKKRGVNNIKFSSDSGLKTEHFTNDPILDDLKISSPDGFKTMSKNKLKRERDNRPRYNPGWIFIGLGKRSLDKQYSDSNKIDSRDFRIIHINKTLLSKYYYWMEKIKDRLQKIKLDWIDQSIRKNGNWISFSNFFLSEPGLKDISGNTRI
ncbi:uncharacterized protein TNCT_514321 [Trichonephila clavata]|uniref:Uncharacterized protein n=1 Tax=Trichonephila clavata TaxID=2740835 RepID=A0A8X6FPQ4_TRICU|nr:uncharacterized protein TNCT_514321 [Trichonephila clavata]